ncbi:MAG TPA: nitrogen regulation protein NR(II) [Gammaproteobacteria bacterium]
MSDTPYEDILEALVTAVLRLDGEDRIEYLNPAAAGLLEASPRHARGKTLADLLPVDETLAAYIARARHGREPLALPDIELAVGPPPGKRRQASCDILPLEAGRVQIEFQLADRRQLGFQEPGLPHDQRAQRLLFQALAHEVKNPLSGMRGAAQLLAAETTDPAHHEYLDIMLRETGRLRDLVDSLLGPARAPRLLAVNIHQVLEHVRGLLSPANDRIAWRRDYDPSLPEMRGDPDQLAQVFLNLMGNAVEALNGVGEIALRTRIERRLVIGASQHRSGMRIDIEDNGPGVPEALRGSLFLPLVTGRADGTGLGLSIAQDIVQRHGGLITWKSEPGRTVFSVLLPVTGSDNGSANE